MGLDLIKGIGLGAGLMYFLDPDAGRGRRALLSDQVTHACCALDDFLAKGGRDLGNRTRGAAIELQHRLHHEPPPDDATLVARVRATLGHLVMHPRAIHVTAHDGHVVLRGPVPAEERAGLVAAIAAVRGVVDVADELEAVAGGEPPVSTGAGARTGSLGENWPPGVKLLAGVAGGALALRLVGRGPMAGLALGVVGMALATRALESGGASGMSRITSDSDARRESGMPGGGRGRVDVTGRTGVYPGSGPLPPGDADVRTPAGFVRGQLDDQGRPVEGGSEPSMMGGTVLGGATPESSSPPAGQASPDTA